MHLQKFNVQQVSRDSNVKADQLAYLASESLPENNITRNEAGTPAFKATNSSDPKEAKVVRCRAARYIIQNDVLDKRSFIHPILWCLSEEDEAYHVLRKIHEGICGNHSGKIALAHKAFRAGYYWPTMAQDAHNIVKSCKKCQQFANVPRSLPDDLTSIFTPWPFDQ
jgi:hypothetical protein